MRRAHWTGLAFREPAPARAALPDSRVLTGHDAVAALMQEWAGSFDDLHAEIARSRH